MMARVSVSSWLLATPLLLYCLVFLAYPTLYAIRLAFSDPHTAAFPSTANFQLIWNDALFWRALRNNVILPAASVAVELLGGLALALLLAARFPGRRYVRAVVVIPFALPEIVFLTMMRYLFAPRGYVNAALVAAGAGPLDWLLPGRWLTFVVVVIADAWHVTPVVFLLLLAALTTIPEEVTEAAQLDGARGLRRLLFITLPLLTPALIAAVLLRGLDALRTFATPLVLTGVEGVPVLSTYAFHQWSDYGNDGAAAAAAVLLALLSVALTLPLLRRRVGP
ncbi:MAG: sugar ABC transporter permease [Deltaproteobacteria bacterium]|nr:sugar ABC transporter permease [Deltaproteobacteria bacterium]